MNCNEINEILNGKRLDEVTPELLHEMEQHLSECESCRNEVMRVTNLKNSLKPSDDLSEYPIPMDVMRQKIELRLQQNQTRVAFGTKLRYAALVIPVFLLFVYFGYYKTETEPNAASSYELNISGVDLELAQNDHHICEMFYDVGLQMASVDVIGCDTTCNLVIFDLQSEAEARLAIAVIKNISERDISTEIVPVSAI